MNIDNEAIEARAYRLAQERFGKGSAPLDDWLRAEWEIKNGSAKESAENSVRDEYPM